MVESVLKGKTIPAEDDEPDILSACEEEIREGGDPRVAGREFTHR